MLEIIQKYSIKAKKSLGQNFLIHEKTLDDISDITSIAGENIVEVWPGFWVLTQKILSYSPSALHLVELDPFMIEVLEDRKNNGDFWKNIEVLSIFHQDVLKYSPIFQDYKVIANIPYYITSPILKRFLYDMPYAPSHMIILMQKEVWERIVSKKSSVLSLFVQKKCTVTLELDVPRHFFSPAPKVDSVVLHFQTHKKYDTVSDDFFLLFIKKAFVNPRKKLINNLMNFWYIKQDLSEIFIKLWFDENIRPEDLSIDQFIALLWYIQK